KRQFEEQLSELDDSYAKGTDEYKALIRGVENLSTIAARAVIANARRMIEELVAADQISAELAAKLYEELDKPDALLNSRIGDKVSKIAQQIAQIYNSFLNLGDSLSYFDEGLGDTISTMGELGQVASDAASSIAGFASGNIVKGIGSAINAISGIFRIGAKSR